MLGPYSAVLPTSPCCNYSVQKTVVHKYTVQYGKACFEQLFTLHTKNNYFLDFSLPSKASLCITIATHPYSFCIKVNLVVTTSDMHTNMHIMCTHAYMHTLYVHTCKHTYAHTCKHTYAHTCTYLHTYIHTYVCNVCIMYIHTPQHLVLHCISPYYAAPDNILACTPQYTTPHTSRGGH